jgi:YtoQ family protein
MKEENWSVYLSGEIHTNWRNKISSGISNLGLSVTISSPITDHTSSDNCGVSILGNEDSDYWKDHKGAKINAIRTRILIEKSDLVVVCFGEKYKQWNAAFDAGYATALNKSMIVIHNDDHQHALKEVDGSAAAVASDQKQAFRILKYILEGSLK